MTAWQNIQMRHSELKMKKEKETLSAEELAEYRTVKEICDKQLEVNALIRSYGKTPQEKLEMDRRSVSIRKLSQFQFQTEKSFLS